MAGRGDVCLPCLVAIDGTIGVGIGGWRHSAGNQHLGDGPSVVHGGTSRSEKQRKKNKTSPHLTPTRVHVVTVDPISKDPNACLKVEAGGCLSLS